MQHTASERLGLPRVQRDCEPNLRGRHQPIRDLCSRSEWTHSGNLGRGRWYIVTADLPQIAAAFGMTPKELQTA